MDKALIQAMRRFLKVARPFLKALEPGDLPAHRAADKALPEWIRTFAQVMEATQRKVALKKLAQAIERRDLNAAMAVIDWANVDQQLRERFKPMIITLMEQSAANAGGSLPPSAEHMVGRFDITNPRAQKWVDDHAGEAVRYISDQSKQAINETLQRAFSAPDYTPEGRKIPRHPYEQARQIREVIGLLPKHAIAVENYRAKLQAANDPKADDKAAKYATKLLNYRAKNIARTETINAATQGQLELWRQARDNGYLDHDQKIRWVVTDDDRLCDECAPMDGAIGTLDGGFPDAPPPPLHQSCRCAVVLDL